MAKPQKVKPTLSQALRQSSELRVYFELMEATAKMVTDDMLDSSFIETWWDEAQNAIYILRKHTAEI